MVGRLEYAFTEQLALSAFLKSNPEAALRVELDLPETGVCSSTRSAPAQDAGGGCCAPAKSACC